MRRPTRTASGTGIVLTTVFLASHESQREKFNGTLKERVLDLTEERLATPMRDNVDTFFDDVPCPTVETLESLFEKVETETGIKFDTTFTDIQNLDLRREQKVRLDEILKELGHEGRLPFLHYIRLRGFFSLGSGSEGFEFGKGNARDLLHVARLHHLEGRLLCERVHLLQMGNRETTTEEDLAQHEQLIRPLVEEHEANEKIVKGIYQRSPILESLPSRSWLPFEIWTRRSSRYLGSETFRQAFANDFQHFSLVMDWRNKAKAKRALEERARFLDKSLFDRVSASTSET